MFEDKQGEKMIFHSRLNQQSTDDTRMPSVVSMTTFTVDHLPRRISCRDVVLLLHEICLRERLVTLFVRAHRFIRDAIVGEEQGRV